MVPAWRDAGPPYGVQLRAGTRNGQPAFAA